MIVAQLDPDGERPFRAAIDADPDDMVRRLVFADWLDEHNDPRADGFRALARLGVQPCHWSARAFADLSTTEFPEAYWWTSVRGEHDAWVPYMLPDPWYHAVKRVCPEQWLAASWLTRREAEDAAALAFVILPPDLKALYLEGKYERENGPQEEHQVPGVDS